MALPTNQEIDNAIRTSNTGTDADRPIRLSTNELLKAFRQEIANTQQDLANKVNNSAFNALAQVARTGDYIDLDGRPQQYGGTGQNTDGYMTQKAVTDALGDKADLVAGKIPVEQLPSSITSGVVFKGTWSAATNQDNAGNPLPATPINDGEYYIVNTAGTQFGLTFVAGDWIIAVDGQWYKLEPDSTVSSVNGQTGAVVIDVGVTSVGVTVPAGLVVANTPITSTGTIDIELAAGYKIPTEAELADRGIEPPSGWLDAGNETKYLAGDGTLKDIPSDTQSDYAQANPNAPDYIKNKPALFSGSYDDLTDKPTIPTKTSELANDSEFITDASLADLNDRVDAALKKTFTPWQPEVIEGTGIDLPNVIDMFSSSDPITLTGSTLRMERTGFPSAEDIYLLNGLSSDSIDFGDTTSLYYKVKSSLDVGVVVSPTYIGFSDSAFDSSASPNALISEGTLSLSSIGNWMGGDVTDFNPPIEVPITDDSEYCVSYDKALNKVTFFVDGVEIASHAFAADFGFNVVTGTVAVNAGNYQGDPSTLTLWGETEFLSNPTHPIAGLEPLIIGTGGTGVYAIDETKYPENPEGKGYEIIGLAQPVQWNELGKEVKSGDFIVFDNDGLPMLVFNDSNFYKKTEEVVIDNGLKVGVLDAEGLSLSTVFPPKKTNIDQGEIYQALFNREMLKKYSTQYFEMEGHYVLGDFLYSGVVNTIGKLHISKTLRNEQGQIIDSGSSINPYFNPFVAHTEVDFDSPLDDPEMASSGIFNYIDAYGGSVNAGFYVASTHTSSNHDQGAKIKLSVPLSRGKNIIRPRLDISGVEEIVAPSDYVPTDSNHLVNKKYVDDSLSGALDNKVDKIQVKETVTANRTLTAADSGKLLIINADGITITMPADSDFNIDIAKMDEDFITIVECAGTDNFREGTATISVIRDVSITNTGIAGKEWLAIGAYEV